MAKKKAAKKRAKRAATKKRSKSRSMKKSAGMSRKKRSGKGAAKKAARKSPKRSAKRAARRAPPKAARMIPATIPAAAPMTGESFAPSAAPYGDSAGDESGLLGGGDEEGSRRSGVAPSSHQQSFESYIRSLPGWQRDAAVQLRAILLDAAPHARETIKWGQPVYEAGGPFAYIKAHRHHLNFGFWRGADLADPKRLLEGEGGQMRHVKIESLAAIDRDALRQFVLAAVALNQQHGSPTRGKSRAAPGTADHAADARAAAAVGLSEVVR